MTRTVVRGLTAAALALLAGCGGATKRAAPPTAVAGAPIPAPLLAEARPIGVGPRFDPAATGPPIGACRRRLGARIESHVEVFAANRVVILPAGIGTRPPRTAIAGTVTGASCYGELVTLQPTGVILTRPGSDARISDLFHSWGQRLTRSRLASFRASGGTQVTAYVDGRLWRAAPGAIPLAPHAEIVVEIGPHVPPHKHFAFPPGP
jgi:hypothetical protein